MAAIYAENVLPWLREWRAAGMRTALVTLVGIDGSAPRPLGSQMAVSENGDAVGNITGGCAEAAIIAEARAAIRAGEGRCVRYGTGSPYIDVKLPCGSGIDVCFDVTLTDEALDRLLTAQRLRQPAALRIDLEARRSMALPAPATAPAGASFVREYLPVTRLVLAGKGPIVPILARLAVAADFEAVALSPERDTLALTAQHARDARHLASPESFDYPGFDRWTAFVSLFHEHEWEPPILAQALASPCFYVGALGSRRTAAARLELLRAHGVGAAALARLHGPVGLDLGARNPPEIAVAILAEIIATRRASRAAA